MLIGNKWKIESDELNVTLFKKRKGKATDKAPAHEIWRVEGYFSNLKNAMKEIVDREINGTGLADLKVISDKLDELHIMIDELKI